MVVKILYDISMEISPDMAVYKGEEEKKPVIIVQSNHNSDNTYVSRISCDLHTGTHIDAPLHMIAGGETMDYFGLDKLLSDCRVLDLIDVEDGISESDLKRYDILPGEVILLKTKNSFENRVLDFVYLTEGGAQYLVEKGVKGVGIDSLGIERSQKGHPTHKKLLSRGIFIIEGLVLKDVSSAEYILLLVPIKIAGVEAAPARAFLLEKDDH